MRTHRHMVIRNAVMKIGQSFLFRTWMNLYEVIGKALYQCFTFFKELTFHFGEVVIGDILILHDFIKAGRQRIENGAELLNCPFHFLQNLLIGLVQNTAGPLHDFRRPFITDGQIKFIVVNLVSGNVIFSFLLKVF